MITCSLYLRELHPLYDSYCSCSVAFHIFMPLRKTAIMVSPRDVTLRFNSRLIASDER